MAVPASPEGELRLLDVTVPAPSCAGDEMAEMALCFVEEFIRMGWDDAAVLELFRSPFYRGPHLVFQRYGEAYVRRLLDQVRSTQ